MMLGNTFRLCFREPNKLAIRLTNSIILEPNAGPLEDGAGKDLEAWRLWAQRLTTAHRPLDVFQTGEGVAALRRIWRAPGQVLLRLVKRGLQFFEITVLQF